MDFVKIEIAKQETHCEHCNESLKYVVTLSDGKLYGINCAKKITGKETHKKISRAKKEIGNWYLLCNKNTNAPYGLTFAIDEVTAIEKFLKIRGNEFYRKFIEAKPKQPFTL